MLRIKLACKIACLLSLCPGAEILADSYGEYRDRRLVDVTGNYYLVLRKLNGWGEDPGRGGPVEFELARRREGSPVVLELIQDRGEQTNGEVKVRAVDTLLCRGELQRAPSRVLISSTGLGFATLDVFGYNYGTIDSNDALIVVSSEGNVLYRKSMNDLFADQLGNFPRTAGGVRWLGGAWIDERRREIVVVGEHKDFNKNPLPLSICVVAFDSGEARQAGNEALVRVLSERNRAALEYVLELVADLRLDEAKMYLPGLLSDNSLSEGTRLRSAVALAAFGDYSGSDLMTGAALKKSEDQSYALRNLPLVVREQAAAILCEAVRRHGESCKRAAWQAMSLVSAEAAVPELRSLLVEASSAGVDFALDCLWSKGPESKLAIPELVAILEFEPKTENSLWTQQLAAWTLGRIGRDAEQALPYLIALAEKHAPEEWHRVKDQQPTRRPFAFSENLYSEDYFVNAIFEIKAARTKD